MHLICLPTGDLSLEFAPDEFRLIRSGLVEAARKLGRPFRIDREQSASHEVLTVAGARFLLMTDDGDPALISTSATGKVILQTAVDTLGKGSTESREAAAG